MFTLSLEEAQMHRQPVGYNNVFLPFVILLRSRYPMLVIPNYSQVRALGTPLKTDHSVLFYALSMTLKL